MKKAVSSGYIVAWSEYLSVFQFCISNKQGTPRITDHLLPLFFHWETNKKNSVNSLLPTELISSSPHGPESTPQSHGTCRISQLMSSYLQQGALPRSFLPTPKPRLLNCTQHTVGLPCPAPAPAAFLRELRIMFSDPIQILR